MPAEHSRWYGFRVILGQDGGAQLIRGDDEVLSTTVGKLHGTGYFGAENGNPIGDWVVTEIVPRGSHLWDKALFHPDGALAKTMTAASVEGNANTIKSLHVGYSPYTLHPVFVNPPQPNTTALQDIELDDALTILRYRAINPEEDVVGSNTILHHSFSIPGNIKALKEILIRGNWNEALQGGDFDLVQAKDLASESRRALHEGNSPVVIARIQPRPACKVPDNGRPNIDDLESPGREEGPTNRFWKDCLPKVDHLLLYNGREKGFVYKVPYMTNMAYPPELYEKLTKFARFHIKDKFNAVAMLFGAQLWVDILEHPDRMAEFMPERSNETPLPHVPLSTFLVYFEPWLKLHEDLRCLQYAHPFRVMTHMFVEDIKADSSAYAVQSDILMEDEIRVLVLKAGVQRPEFPANTRVAYYPFLMNGTTMAAPQDFDHHAPFSPTQQALIGMPSIQVLGPPSFEPQAGHKRQIAMPIPIARLSLHGLETPLHGPYPAGFRDVRSASLTSQLGQATASGTIWSHEFEPIFDPAAISQRTWAFSPALDPSLNMDQFILPSMLTTWTQKMNRRLEWLQHLGVLGKVALHCGIDGLPCFHGMPLEHDAHLIPPSSSPRIVARAFQDVRNCRVVPVLLLPSSQLTAIISALNDRPKLSHVAWSRALNHLAQMESPERLCTVLSVREELVTARAQYIEDLEELQDLLRRWSVNAMLAENRPVYDWPAQHMRRMVGTPAGLASDPDEWEDNAGLDMEDEEEEALLHIDAFLDLARLAVRSFRISELSVEGRRMAKAAQLHLKSFLERVQQNGPIPTAVEEHINGLDNYARSQGYGSVLP
ncbi:hypothetical protein ACJ41O_015183 [Fusarium nematophilum]